MDLANASARVAIAALLHDLGKLAERAGVLHDNRLDANMALYCPWQADGSYHSHVHAAYTELAWDSLMATGHFPDLDTDSPPFAVRRSDASIDSAVNAASAHHRPDTFLQWIIATADRVALGFERDAFDSEYNFSKERDNHECARLLTLFEQIGRGRVEEGALEWRYPLAPMSPGSIFPQRAEECTPRDNSEAKAEYGRLWSALLEGLQTIPQAHLTNLGLWLDHFDSLWLVVSGAIPAATAFGVKPEVSLYDHSKAAASLATALWRWHHDLGLESAASVREGWDEPKFLLLQGDFFGIQDFIFAEGGATQKHAHKLLRGRSFQVSLLAECGALKLLEAIDLPSTSQIVNAAGKFLIVAPNTESARAAIRQCQTALDTWCLEKTYGEIGVGLATTPASCNDFVTGRFGELSSRLFEALDDAKHRRFDLCAPSTGSVFEGFLNSFDNALGVCGINGRHPADPTASRRRGYPISRLADDQIRIGEALTKQSRLLVVREPHGLPVLGLDYFGYRLALVPAGDVSGKYGGLARSGQLVRAWDFDPAEADGALWRGYAHRFVNSYVPRFDAADEQMADRYGRWESEAEFDRDRPIKTLQHIACEDLRLSENKKWTGEAALLTIKGDIDNLGMLLQQGLAPPTFAKMISLSRQINAFFALWLPWYCEHSRDNTAIARFRNTYTVFSGGDDFFLIGPWDSTLSLASILREKFSAYVTGNGGITFSTGCAMTKPQVPVRHLARSADRALEAAKSFGGKGTSKNAISLWGITVGWQAWSDLMATRMAAMEDLMVRAGSHGAAFSGSLLYSLLLLSDRSGSSRPEDAIWRSQLHYRLARFFRDRVKGGNDVHDRRQQLLEDAIREIGDALGTYKAAYRLPLSVLLYRRRR